MEITKVLPYQKKKVPLNTRAERFGLAEKMQTVVGGELDMCIGYLDKYEWDLRTAIDVFIRDRSRGRCAFFSESHDQPGERCRTVRVSGKIRLKLVVVYARLR